MTTVGDMISFSTTIDETKHGNSYLEFPELLWDFQKYFVTLFKTGLDTLRVQFNQCTMGQAQCKMGNRKMSSMPLILRGTVTFTF